MTLLSFVHAERRKLTGTAAVSAVAAVIGAAFGGSTLVTPLYAMYKEQFGFSQITLTLVYVAYVLGNLAALLFFGCVSDEIATQNHTCGDGHCHCEYSYHFYSLRMSHRFISRGF